MRASTRRHLRLWYRRARLPIWAGAVLLGASSTVVFADFTGKLPAFSFLGNDTSTTATIRAIRSSVISATSFGNCTWDATHDVAACVNLAFTAANAAGGGTVFIPTGATPYALKSPILMRSNTRLMCAPGSELKTLGASWPGGPKLAVTNINRTASVITDKNLFVEGCNFTEDATFAADGQFHAMDFRMARHIRLDNNTCTAGGDCATVLASDDWVFSRNRATGIINACWDPFEASTNGDIEASNYCESSLYGVQPAGTDVAQTSAGVTSHLHIAGTYKMTGTLGAAIWLAGIGAAGSGVTDTVIDHPIVYYSTPGVQQTCIKVSGSSKRIKINTPICVNSGINTANDSGGTPSEVTMTGPTVSGYVAGGGSFNPIEVTTGNHVMIAGPRVIKGAGSYTYGLGIFAAATNTVLSGSTDIEAGSVGTINNLGSGTTGSGTGTLSVDGLLTSVGTLLSGAINWTGNIITTGYVSANGSYVGNPAQNAAFLSVINNAGVYPPSNTTAFALGDHFNATHEMDLWNLDTAATKSFRFYQKTGASAATLVLDLGPTGPVSPLLTTPMLVGYAVASLPAGTIGMLAYVTDQVTACPAKGVAPTNGGALKCVVLYNGTAWVGI